MNPRLGGNIRFTITKHSMRTLSCVALIAVIGAVTAQNSATTQPIPNGSNEAAIVAAAEAEGQHYPDGGKLKARQCVISHETGPSISGEFTIGGNLGGSQSLHAGRIGKIWWSPLTKSERMPPLVVRGRDLSTLTDTVRFTSPTISFPVGPVAAAAPPPSQRQYFFPSGFSVPRAGRWLVIATSGKNWGCFILTVV